MVNIIVARDKFPLVMSSLDLSLTSQLFHGKVDSLFLIGSRVGIGFVYLVCIEYWEYLPRCVV